MTPAKDIPSKSIDFLLKNAGPVIQYRLRKEILNNLPKKEEETLLQQIYDLPYFKLVEKYAKPSGYIGNGMHSLDHWRGQVLHETPLQDGETAARLLSYYAVPKEHPLVKNFVNAMRDEEILQKEFSYISPEIPRFENRFIGINNGNCLMALLYTMQAMLGYGDDFDDILEFQQTALKGFQRILELSSLDEILKKRTGMEKKYKYPYIEADEYFPDVYTLEVLAYTKSWRTKETVQMLADSLNHINKIMKPENQMHVKIKNKYYAPCFAFATPLKTFSPDLINTIVYRRILTEIAMLGVGNQVDVIRDSIINIKKAVNDEGVLEMNLKQPHNKRYSPKSIEYPTAYVDVRLEADYKRPFALDCDLTFWAVQLLHITGN